MAKRFEQNYRVKRRDNLGDPEYWNVRLEDIDRRISANEDGLTDVEGLGARIEGVALTRLNDVLFPALDAINRASDYGFLNAELTAASNVTFEYGDMFLDIHPDFKQFFRPSPWVMLIRESNADDRALCKLIAYNNTTGVIQLECTIIWGSTGPHNDLSVWGVAGSALGALNAAIDVSEDAAAAQAAATVSTTKAGEALQSASDALSYKNAAETAATNAQAFDPTVYYTGGKLKVEYLPTSVPQYATGGNLDVSGPSAVSRLKIGVSTSVVISQARNAADSAFAKSDWRASEYEWKINTTVKMTMGTDGGVYLSDVAGNSKGDGTFNAKGYFLKGKGSAFTSQSISGSHTLDFSTFINKIYTVTGNITLDTSNVVAGETSGVMVFQQDSTGGRTWGFVTGKFAFGGAAPVMPTAAFAKVAVPYFALDDGRIFFSMSDAVVTP